MDLENVFKKYNVKSDGIERYYSISLNHVDYEPDGSTPLFLSIEDHLIQKGSWIETVFELTKYLYNKYPKDINDIYNFSVTWSKSKMFYNDFNKIKNSRLIDDNLYVSVNFTSTHSIWFIYDLLNFYNIDINDCLLVVYRVPKGEPAEVQQAVEMKAKEEFASYLKTNGFAEERIENIISSFKVINSILSKMNTGYNNFFLINNNMMFSTLKSKFLDKIESISTLNSKQIETVKRYLDYYSNYCTYRKREYNKQKTNTENILLFVKPNEKVITIFNDYKY